MKLFIVAALIAVTSAGRLEHLERSYLPPTQGVSQGRFGSQPGFGSLGGSGSNSIGGHGGFGSGSTSLGGHGGFGSGPNSLGGHGGFGSGPNSLGGHGGFGSGPNSLGGHGGFGSGPNSLGGHGGFGSGSLDSNRIEPVGARSGSFGSSAFPGATINQYLPPDHGPSGSSGPQFAGSLQGLGNGNQRSQYTPQSSFGAAPQYSGSQFGAPSFGSQGRYQQGGSQFGGQGQGSSQFPATSRQYLAPKSSSNYPQQSFDEETGYHY